MTPNEEELAALRWAVFEAGRQKMATTKLAIGGPARRAWRHELATHERALERLLSAKDPGRVAA
jgi:hypothetical protein